MSDIQDAFLQTMSLALIIWLLVLFLDENGKIYYWSSWICGAVGLVCALGAIWIGVL